MASQHPMQTREVRTTERGVRCYYVKVDGSAVAGGTDTTDGLLLGSQHMTITENGNGDYSLNLNVPGQRVVGVSGVGLTAASVITVDASSASQIDVLQTTASTGAALADADFWLQVYVSTSADET